MDGADADVLTSRVPPKAELVPPDRLIVESLGWQPGIWGAFLLVLTGWIYVQKDPPHLRLSAAAAALAGGAALVRYEARRRSRRTALFVRGPVVGIYRRGELALAVPREEILLYVASYVTTVKFILAPLFFGLLGLLPLSDVFNPRTLNKPPLLDVLTGLGLAAAGLASAVSLVWTRHVWLTFRLPRPNGVYEDFNIPRSSAHRMTPE